MTPQEDGQRERPSEPLDRNDHDDQLFGQFQRCADIPGQTPLLASGREHLRELLNRASGGVVFTTIHKFMPKKAIPLRQGYEGRGRCLS